MRDDDLTPFNPAEGDPPSAEFVDTLLEQLEVTWHSQADGHDTGLSPTSIDLTVLDDKDDPMGFAFYSGDDDRLGTRARVALVAAAAAAIVILIVGLVVFNDGGDEGGVVTTDQPDDGGAEEAPTAQQAPTTEAAPTAREAPTPEAAPPRVDSEWDFDITYVEVGSVGAVAANDESAWVASGDGTLSRIDLATNMVVSTASIASGPRQVNYGFGSVWITHVDGTVSRFDPDTETVVARIPVGEGSLGWIGPGLETMWLANRGDQQAVSIDPTTNAVSAVVDIEGGCCGAIKEQAHGVWIHGGLSGVVHRIDPDTGSVVASVPVGGSGPMMAGPEAVWVRGGRSVFRIDPATNSVTATIDISEAIDGVISLGGIHFGGGTVWVRYHYDGGTGVLRIDPATNEVVAHQDLREGWAPTGGMNVGPTTAWTFNSDAIARIDFDN